MGTVVTYAPGVGSSRVIVFRDEGRSWAEGSSSCEMLTRHLLCPSCGEGWGGAVLVDQAHLMLPETHLPAGKQGELLCEAGGGSGRGANRTGCSRRFLEGSGSEEGWHLESHRDRERRAHCVLGCLGNLPGVAHVGLTSPRK